MSHQLRGAVPPPLQAWQCGYCGSDGIHGCNVMIAHMHEVMVATIRGRWPLSMYTTSFTETVSCNGHCGWDTQSLQGTGTNCSLLSLAPDIFKTVDWSRAHKGIHSFVAERADSEGSTKHHGPSPAALADASKEEANTVEVKRGSIKPSLICSLWTYLSAYLSACQIKVLGAGRGGVETASTAQEAHVTPHGSSHGLRPRDVPRRS